MFDGGKQPFMRDTDTEWKNQKMSQAKGNEVCLGRGGVDTQKMKTNQVHEELKKLKMRWCPNSEGNGYWEADPILRRLLTALKNST